MDGTGLTRDGSAVQQPTSVSLNAQQDRIKHSPFRR